MKTALAPSVAQGLALTMQTRAASVRGSLEWALSALGLELRRLVAVMPDGAQVPCDRVDAIPEDVSVVSSIETNPKWTLRLDHVRGASGRLDVEVQARILTPNGEGFAEALLALREMLERLVRGGEISSARVTRIRGNPGLLPEPPIATWAHLVVTSRAHVSEAYEEPARLFEAFDLVAEQGDHVLLSRAMEAASLASLLSDIAADTWALARVARPRRTVYLEPVATLEEQLDEPPALERVGYITPGDIVEYAAVLGARHVTPREVFGLGALVRSRKIRLARKTVPVAVVRVVFRSMDEALRERRPLTDQGVEVWAYGTADALVQLDP